MTVESNYVIGIATLNDWLKRLAPVFQPMRSKTKTMYMSHALSKFAPVRVGWSNCFGFGFSTVI